jgi:hypothetical protein
MVTYAAGAGAEARALAGATAARAENAAMTAR